MKMLKVMPLACAALLLLGACSGSKKSDSGKHYSDVNTEINVWATAAEEAVIKKVVDEYNAKQTEDTAKFNYKFTAVSEADCGSTLGKDPTVAGAPALALVADDQIYNLQSKGVILEVKGSYKEGVIANNSEVSVKGASFGDSLFGFPVTSDNGYFLWYNKKALSSEDVKSFETILAKAQEQGKKFNMEVANGYYVNSFFMSPTVCGLNSLSWKENNDGKVVYETTWDNEAGAAAAEYVASVIAPAYTAGTFTDKGNDGVAAGFEDGTMIAAISGTWMEADLSESLGEDLGAVKLPEFHIGGKAHQMASFSGSKVYTINKTRPIGEQKAAAALADLLTSKDAQLARFDIRKTLPCNKEAAASEEYTSKVSISGAALSSQNEFACVQSLTAEDRYWPVGENIGKAIRANSTGGGTWAEFLKAQLDIIRAPLA